VYKTAFGCHGLFDVDDDIASSRRSSLYTLDRDHEMDKSDIPTIRVFYYLNKKCYDTPLRWDCALFRVLGYTERYDEKRNGLFPKLLSLDPQIISQCIDDDAMNFDDEIRFGLHVLISGTGLWAR